MNQSIPHIAILSANTFERIGLIQLLNEQGVDKKIIQLSSFNDLLDALSKYHIECIFLSEAFHTPKNLEALNKIGSKTDTHKIIQLTSHKEFKVQLPITHSLYTYKNDDEYSFDFNHMCNEIGDEQNFKSTGLSDREIEILRLVALGKTNKEISDELFISTHTVIAHRKNITAKLGIKTISGLTVYAIINKIISTTEVSF